MEDTFGSMTTTLRASYHGPGDVRSTDVSAWARHGLNLAQGHPLPGNNFGE